MTTEIIRRIVRPENEPRTRPNLLRVARWLKQHSSFTAICPDESWRRHGCTHTYRTEVGMSVTHDATNDYNAVLVFKPTIWGVGGHLCRPSMEEEAGCQDAAERAMREAWGRSFYG